MIRESEIQQFVDQVARRFDPERVVLFGSYARGAPHASSDVDLLVIMAHDSRNIDKACEITRSVDRSFPLDLIVRKPDETRRRLKDHDVFLGSVMREGRVLYARPRTMPGWP